MSNSEFFLYVVEIGWLHNAHPICGPPVHGQKLNKHVIKCHQAEQVLY